MDAALFQAIAILTQCRSYTMTTKVTLPHKIKKTVPAFDMRKYGEALLTMNATEIHGHAPGELLLSTLIFRPVYEGGTAAKIEVEYQWIKPEPVGGIQPDRLYSSWDHTKLPGVESEVSGG